jgi:hypothetical protein
MGNLVLLVAFAGAPGGKESNHAVGWMSSIWRPTVMLGM